MYCRPAAPHLLHILAGHLCLSSRRSSLLLLHTCLLPQLSCCSAEAKRQVKSVPLPFALAFTGLTYSTLCEGCPCCFATLNETTSVPDHTHLWYIYTMYVHALHIKSIIIHACAPIAHKPKVTECHVYSIHTYFHVLLSNHTCMHSTSIAEFQLPIIHNIINKNHTYIHT